MLNIDDDHDLDDDIDDIEESEHDTTDDEQDDSVSGDDAGDDSLTEESEEDRSALRARRREEKKRKKEKHKQYLSGLESEARQAKELAGTLAREIELLKNSGLNDRLTKIQSEISEAERVYNQAQAQYNDALKQNDPVGMVQAQRAMDIAENAYNSFNGQKSQLTEQAKQTNNPATPALNQQALSLREQWGRKNPDVYKMVAAGTPEGNDIAMIDAMVYRGGYRPDTEAYWNELDRRVKLALPHLYDSGRSDTRRQERPKTAMVGSATNVAAKSSSTTSFAGVTTSQVNAMKTHFKEAWNDPVRRKRMLENAREQNKRNGI